MVRTQNICWNKIILIWKITNKINKIQEKKIEYRKCKEISHNAI
jgi:hypothetical protein